MHSVVEAAPDSLPGNCAESGGELPDICPSLPTDTIDSGREPYLEVRGDGEKRYRFDAVLWNAGGAFELEGRDCSAQAFCNEVWQRIWTGDGVPGGDSRYIRIPGRLVFDVGDGHNHFHFENAARYEIVVPDGPDISSEKVGFCMFDTYPDPDGSGPPAFYRANCPLSGGTVGMGIARGWGDYYNLNLAGQWVIVNGLRAGKYTMRAEVNPGQEFEESNLANNVLETEREIPGATANDVAASTEPNVAVTVGLSGTVEGTGVQVRNGGQTFSSASARISFRIIDAPAHGSLAVIEQTDDTNATVVYTPDVDYSGPDSFTYRTTDSRGLDSLTRTVSINVSPPPAPPPPTPTEPTATVEPTGSEPPPTPTRAARRLTVRGTAAAETITGTGSAEVFRAGAGSDTIYARGGRDLVRGGKGNDRIFGGSGIDKILAGRGNDVVRARDGKIDEIDCGRGKRDRAIVDAFDVVAANCEIVVLPT